MNERASKIHNKNVQLAACNKDSKLMEERSGKKIFIIYRLTS